MHQIKREIKSIKEKKRNKKLQKYPLKFILTLFYKSISGFTVNYVTC